MTNCLPSSAKSDYFKSTNWRLAAEENQEENDFGFEK